MSLEIDIMHINAKTVLSVMLLLTASCVQADLTGLWEEYDDDSGKLAALIRINKRPDNVYEGVVEKVVEKPEGTAEPLCTQCQGELHNRPLLGLRILSDMKRKGKQHYEGGEILDPDDGKTYKCRIQLSADENTLQLTGFLNFSWIGQSEIWRRSE